MGKSQRITDQHLRGIYRVASDVREARHDPMTMHARLIDGLMDLVGGTCGFACEVADWRPGGDIRISGVASDTASSGAIAELMRGLARNGNCWDDPSIGEGVKQTGDVVAVPFHRLVPDDEFRRSYPLFYDLKRDHGHLDHLLAWHRTGPSLRDMRAVAVHRWGKGQRRFGRRETEIARLLFDELNWLDATGRLAPAVPALAGLPPRLADVLALLRTGQSPKQIAARLGLSVYTVRDHIKRLYARAGVGDRGALMALLNGNAAGNGDAGATPR